MDDARRAGEERLRRRRRSRRAGDVEAALERARDPGRGARADRGRARGRRCPTPSATPLRDGLRAEALPDRAPPGRGQGLSNQMVRRLERLEGDLLAERHARVDDLALLVDLITRAGGRRTSASTGSSGRSSTARRGALRVAEPEPAPAADPHAEHQPVRYAARLTPSPARSPAGRARTGAAPDLGVEVDPAAERRRELLGDRQPEPGAAGLRDERAEQPLALLRRDAGACVLDRDVTGPFSRWSSSVIRPPSGVARNAFESRLSTIWSTRSPSETITGLSRTSTR